MIDLDSIRSETPGVDHSTYLHSAGSALPPQTVLDAVMNHLDLEAIVGGYTAAARESERIDAVYDSLARLLNAGRTEIAITENATVGWQLAFYSQQFGPGDRILTGEAEYAANYVAYLQVSKRTGVSVEVIPSAENGELDVTALESMIDDRVKLISITWVPTNGGLVNPAAEVGRVAKKYGITYLLDACQAVGQLPVDVKELNCDFLTATGRKFLRGPRGTGFLYVSEKMLESVEPPMIDHFGAPWTSRGDYTLRADARRFETWENAYALRLGLGAAAEYALSIGIDNIHERSFGLAQELRSKLAENDRVTIHDLGAKPCSIVSFSVDGIDAADVVTSATENGITIGTTPPNSTLLDSEARGLPVLVRASPHYYNTETEVARLSDLVNALTD